MAKKREIVMTFWNGLVEDVKNIPKGQTVITRDIDEGGECEIYLRRWHSDGTNELIYEGPLEGEPKL